MKLSALLFWLVAFVVLAAVVGCDWGATNIASIAEDPFRYQARSLTVRGTVAWSGYLPEVGSRAFELEQGSARLLVLSTRPSPEVGTRLKVAGCVEAYFDLGDRRAPVLIDEDPGPKKDGGASDVR
jgi:hypothetical protein